MMLLGACNAVGRYLEPHVGVRLTSNWMLELQWYLFSLVFLLGAPHALRTGGHVRVDVLYEGLPARGRCWIDLIGTVVFLMPFCAFAIWTSIEFVADSWSEFEMSNDPGGLPRYPLKTVVPITFALLLLQGISEAVKRAALLTGVDPNAVEIGEEDAE